ncbi:MAG: carbohydrate ABC transporter permease [Shimia sp.]
MRRPWITWGLLLVAGIVTLAPFVYMLAVSLAPSGQVYAGTLLPLPSPAAAVENYATAFRDVPLARYMANGAFVCAVILVAQVTIAAPAGYALAKLPFRGRPVLLAMVITALMIPMQVPAIPLYVAVAYAGLLNTYTALIVPFVISAFAIFLFRQFFLSYPDEVLDAARLDGMSELGIVWRLMVPAAWPAVAAFATISIINHWNDLYWPLVVITDPSMMTPPLGLATFASTGETTGNVGALMAGGVVVTLPLVVAFAIFQRTLIRGLGLGARA